MDEKLEQYRSMNLALCNRLIQDLNRNRLEADRFFRGDICRAYIEATEKASDKMRKIRNKIRNL